MAFSFNFSGATNEIFDEKVNFSQSMKDLNEDKLCIEVPCKFVSLQDMDLNIPYHTNSNKVKCGNLEIQFIAHKEISSKIEHSKFIEDKQSDLQPGKYEGGLKVWECAYDLSNFLSETNCIRSGYTVLELGCGVGLPGIVAYLCGAAVTFQDFNYEVLEFVTTPNVFLNTSEQHQPNIEKTCKFLCGDWQSILEKYFNNAEENIKFDVILTSETIYEKKNQMKLLNLMKAALKPDGVIYLAAKVYYFGVGGGIAYFVDLVKKDGIFDVETVFKTFDGVERQILKLMFKKTIS